MKKYPSSIRNSIENTLRLLWARIFRPKIIEQFIAEQVDFQYKQSTTQTAPPSEIQDWWAMWFQNATVDFRNENLRTSAKQIRFIKGRLIANNSEGIHKRLAAMGNDLKKHGANETYCIDTIDAAYSRTAFPVFSYNRLKGLKERFLWPLEGYHSIGDQRFLSVRHKDRMAFGDKKSKIFWRGKLNGQIENKGEQLTLVKLLTELHEKGGNISASNLTLLRKFPRFKALDTFVRHPRFDIGLSPKDKKPYTDHPYISNWFRPYVPFGQQLDYRYLLAIGGSDIATNFYRSLDSNSIVFKVNTPWEGFLDGQFKPWTHYVPIEFDYSDIEEKFDWCESNHSKCVEIVQAA